MTAAVWSVLLGTAGFLFMVAFVVIFGGRLILTATGKVPNFGTMHLLAFTANAAAVSAFLLTLGLVAAGLPAPWNWLAVTLLAVAGAALVVRAHRRRRRVAAPAKLERHYWTPADVLPEDRL